MAVDRALIQPLIADGEWHGEIVAQARGDGGFGYDPHFFVPSLEQTAAELAPGAWLVSLEFEATGYKPQARLETVKGKPVWLYQVPFKRR